MSEARQITRRVHVVQGEHAISTGDPGEMMTTVLGSCVAACIRDPKKRIGGMNHFLLPGESGGADDVRFGVYAMEVLINGLLTAGAKRQNLEAKLFGGGRMMQGLSDVGASNARFAKSFIENEGITYLGGSLGGDAARRIQFWPYDGFARQALIDGALEQETKRERKVAEVAKPDDGELELF